MNIPIARPYFGEEERRAVTEPLDSGWVVQGPKVAEFERCFSTYTGARYSVATTSCTTGLQLALAAVGVGPGDEVVLPSFTWVASANAVEALGASAVFADIDLPTFSVSLLAIEKALTRRTKAVMPVSLFGLSVDMTPIVELAKTKGLKVVEDAACALGARYKEYHAGTLADAGCFSFHPRKLITTGEGGMIITANQEIAEQLRKLRDHGASVSDLERHLGKRGYLLPDFEMAGFNYRMTDLQGALGIVQMGRLPGFIDERRRLARRYDEALSRAGWLIAPEAPREYVHAYQAYVALYAPDAPSIRSVERFHIQRNQLMDHLERAGIATRPGTHAVHALGYYRRKYDLLPESLPNAYVADRLSLALPLFPGLTDQQQQYVIDQLLAWKP